eukprot:377381_1
MAHKWRNAVMDEKISCGASVSLLSNNLALYRKKSNVMMSYVHRSDVWITSSDSFLNVLDELSPPSKGSKTTRDISYKVPFEENEPINQVKWCKFDFGTVLVVITQRGRLRIYDE